MPRYRHVVEALDLSNRAFTTRLPRAEAGPPPSADPPTLRGAVRPEISAMGYLPTDPQTSSSGPAQIQPSVPTSTLHVPASTPQDDGEGDTQDEGTEEERQDILSARRKVRLTGVSVFPHLSSTPQMAGDLAVTYQPYVLGGVAERWTVTTAMNQRGEGASSRVFDAPFFHALAICAADNVVLTATVQHVVVGSPFPDSPAIIVQFRPYLLRPDTTTSAGTPHPEATRPTRLAVKCRLFEGVDGRNIKVQCSPGGLVVVLARLLPSDCLWESVYVLDWKAGVCLGCDEPIDCDMRYTSSLFIGRNRLLCGGICLNHYDTNVREPQFKVFKYDAADSPPKDHPDGDYPGFLIDAVFVFPKTRLSRPPRDDGLVIPTNAHFDAVILSPPHDTANSSCRIMAFRIGNKDSVAMLSDMVDRINDDDQSVSSDADAYYLKWEDWRHLVHQASPADRWVRIGPAFGSRVCAEFEVRQGGINWWIQEIREYDPRLHDLLLNQEGSTWTPSHDVKRSGKPIYVRTTIYFLVYPSDGSATWPIVKHFSLDWEGDNILVLTKTIRPPHPPQVAPTITDSFSLLHLSQE